MINWIKAKNGKEFPINFSQGAMRRLARVYEIPFDEIAKFADISKWDIAMFDRLTYFAIQGACRAERIPFEMTEEQFMDFVDDNDGFSDEAMKLFVQSNVPEEEKKATAPNKNKGR